MKKADNKPEENYEDIIKATQEQAIKAIHEQAQAMFANIPGFQMPGMEDLQAQIQAQMQACVPNLDQIQAAQAALGAPGGMPAGTTNSGKCVSTKYGSGKRLRPSHERIRGKRYAGQ